MATTTPQNPFVGTDDGETVENVRNVLEFMAWHRLDGDDTAEIADGRRLILETASEALSTLIR